MSELLVDFITSLDGYGAAEGWPGFWGLQGPEYMKWLGEQPEGHYTILMGANTYRLMSNMGTENPDEGAAMDGLAMASKVVFSSTLQPPLAWPNTQLIHEDAVEAVRKMKQEDESPGRLPCDHWEHRLRPHLRRLSRCRPRHDYQPNI